VPNALAQETSPYLRQHAANPVDWHPWGSHALTLAREENRPLLVSIGYSACHWCHVMERESFEDPSVAALMNKEFVCVKIDREERPDLDAIYMEAVQSMTGRGGWPLNVFLTPEQLPFYGGTYFPPEPRHGMPAWSQVLLALAEAWHERPAEIRAGGQRLRERLSASAQLEPSSQPIGPGALDVAVEGLRGVYDADRGGFGGAPKFPPSSALEFLMRRAATQTSSAETVEGRMALDTLRAMARGGIHDQVGGGFHRYAVDGAWTVPHFEKMLYDNALLARAYLHGFQLSGEELLRRTCEEILDWALRDMRAPDGGFYSALDADSEGVEGKFYVWSLTELSEALTDREDLDAAIAWLGPTPAGNFRDESAPADPRAIEAEGANVLESRGPEPPAAQRARIRTRLRETREQRVAPGLDDKRLTSWNALTISALAEAGAVLERPDYLQAAVRCAEFILEDMRSNDSGAADEPARLLRTYNHGQARLAGYLEDHAFLLEALLTLYEATFHERWFVEARRLADTTIELFGDPQRGGFFSTASDHEDLITRRKDLEDAPIPAGASSAAFGLLRLAALTGEHRYEQHAVGVLRLLNEIAPRHPSSFGHLLQAMDFHVSAVKEVAIVGERTEELVRLVRQRLRPHLVLAGGPEAPATPGAVELLRDRTAIAGHATAYVCESFACAKPVTEPHDLARLLGDT
jgi:uncharacterized protein YyaL (SSP411 family)